MITKKNKILKIVILAIIFIGLRMGVSKATIHSTDPSGTTDSTVSITVTSTEALENFDLSITSTGGLTYSSVSTSGVPNQSTGAVSYAGLTGLTTLATYTFQTPSTPGRYQVSFSVNGIANNSFVTVTAPETSDNNANNNTDNNADEETSGNNETTPTTTTTKSNNANLSNLGIRPNDFTGFRPGTTAYNVTVPNEVEEVTVYANLQDTKASLTGTGVQNLEVGRNTLNVVVTAEDGTQKTYTINVTREEETEQENTTSDEGETELEEGTITSNTATDLINLEVTGYELTPEFSPSIYEYTLHVNGDITSLDIVTEGANHNVSIEVVGNTDLKDGENIITILVHNEETNLNSTYQIIVNKTNIDLETVNTTLNEGVKEANQMRYVVVGVLLFIIVCMILFIIVRKRYKAQDVADDIYEYDEEDKERMNHERLNLDEEEEFFSRVNQKKGEDSESVEDERITTIGEADTEELEKGSELENTGEEKIEYAEPKETEEEWETTRTKRKGKHF